MGFDGVHRASLERAKIDAGDLAHLDPEFWDAANRRLLSKAITEFSHELLIRPQAISAGEDRFILESRSGRVRYTFRGRWLRLEHLLVDSFSICRHVDGKEADLDALSFMIEFGEELGIGAAMMPVYLAEISSILYASAFAMANKPNLAEDLASADFQTIERTMNEGHPVFVANSGRLGFSAEDYPVFAPEAASPMPILWLAVCKAVAAYSAVPGLAHEELLAEELGPARLAVFREKISALGLDPASYLLMPVHPWQWKNRIAMGFAAAIARRDIVLLGASEDLYQPQQSTRTFYNVSTLSRRYVKMALSILNMGFVLDRGLSPADMARTPAANEWVRRQLEGDPFLMRTGFSLIYEVAAISYRDPWLTAAIDGNSPHKNALAALWRENPNALLKPGERLMTMAALLHRDSTGRPLIGALITNSTLDSESWIKRYLDAYLAPLIHCLYTYDIVFMPHGENVVLILKDHAVERIIVKDIAEEMRILDGESKLPQAVRPNFVQVPDDLRLDGIFTDIFDCFFRPLAALLDEGGILGEARFWHLVAACIARYQSSQPELAGKFQRFDLFTSDFPRNCLNRLQLRDNRKLIEPGNPERDFEFRGRLANPIAEFVPGKLKRE